MALENAQKIITKLTFVTHNFSAIKNIFQEKEARDALVIEEPNLHWERYKQVLAKNDKELSDLEDDFPFALVFMRAMMQGQDPDQKEPEMPKQNHITAGANNDALEQELAQEINKRAYDQ